MKPTVSLPGYWEVEDQIVVIKVQSLALHVLNVFLADKKLELKQSYISSGDDLLYDFFTMKMWCKKDMRFRSPIVLSSVIHLSPASLNLCLRSGD